MKKIRVEFILGSGLSEGSEVILYETKEEFTVGGLNSIKDWILDRDCILGVVRGCNGKTIEVDSDDKFTIIEDEIKEPEQKQNKTSSSKIVKKLEEYLNNQKLAKAAEDELNDFNKQIEEIKKKKGEVGVNLSKIISTIYDIELFFDDLNISLDEGEGEIKEKCPLENFLIANNLVEKFMDGRYSDDNDLALEEYFDKYGEWSIRETRVWWNSGDCKDIDWEDVDKSFRNYLDTL